MSGNVYETNKQNIIAAMDAVINKLDLDEGSPRKVKRVLLTEIKDLYDVAGGQTQENFELFVKIANTHTGFNLGGSTESLKLFEEKLNGSQVSLSVNKNERFDNIDEAQKAIKNRARLIAQPVQEVVLQPDPAQALRDHQAAHRALLEDEKS
ncbi:MAG TPA: hypothetical protein DCZ80_00450, partial [Legionellales bacterium]|nr:hypothetical protein [Legionellales bacterium]